MTPDQFSRRTALGVIAAFAAAPALAQPAAKAAPPPPPPPLAPADQALVDKAIAYLQGLQGAKGRFTQTDPRGGVTQGSIFLQRPGKARFAYDPPSGLLVVSNGSTVNVLDRKLGSFQSYPIGATPLSLFLTRQIRVDRGVQVTKVNRLTDGFEVTARDGRSRGGGAITLIFSTAPVLRGWRLTDPQGQITRFVLTEFGAATGLDPALFVLRDPRPNGGARPR